MITNNIYKDMFVIIPLLFFMFVWCSDGYSSKIPRVSSVKSEIEVRKWSWERTGYLEEIGFRLQFLPTMYEYDQPTTTMPTLAKDLKTLEPSRASESANGRQS